MPTATIRLRSLSAAVITLVLLLLQIAVVPPAHAEDVLPRAEKRLHQLLNDDRESRGLNPVVWHDDLRDVARDWANELNDSDMSHHNPNLDSEVQDADNVGEVLQRVFVDDGAEPSQIEAAVEALHSDLMESDSHRAIMLDPRFEHVGIGVVYDHETASADEDAVLAVGVFRDPAGQTDPDPDPDPEPDPEPTPSPDPDEPVSDVRVAGGSRIDTAVAISRTAFPDGSKHAVIATAHGYADALAGAPYANALDAPVLLTDTGNLPTAVIDELARLDVEHVHILGGTVAVTSTVEQQARDLDYQTTRLAGGNRYDTARLVAAEVLQLTGTTAAFLVEGANANPSRGWPDAVSASSVAAATGRPILLTSSNTLPDDTRDAIVQLDITHVTIAGGTVAVSDTVKATVDQLDGTHVERIAGGSRYDTSVKLVEHGQMYGGLTPSTVWLATGLNWPDALTAGPAAAATGTVMLLIDGANPDGAAEVYDYLADQAAQISRLHIVGGDGAITEQVRDKIADTVDSAR